MELAAWPVRSLEVASSSVSQGVIRSLCAALITFAGAFSGAQSPAALDMFALEALVLSTCHLQLVPNRCHLASLVSYSVAKACPFGYRAVFQKPLHRIGMFHHGVSR